MKKSSRRWVMALLMSLPHAGTVAGAQEDALAGVRMLYAEASYTEALRALGEPTTAEGHQYRALCLLALGRMQELQRVLETLTTSFPAFHVNDGDVPPRLASLIGDTRQRVLPGVLKRLLASGRNHFQAKAFEAARSDLETLLALANDPTLPPETADVRVIASGYLDLIERAAPVAQVIAPPQVPSAPETPAVAAGGPVVTAAVPLRQPVPPWPSVAGPLANGGVAVVRLRITADGRVTSARMERGLHPQFDHRLVIEAHGWRYRPATINGVPVETETVVSVRIAP